MTADAFSFIETQNYEQLLGDSYDDPALELAYLRQVVAQHIAHSHRLEHENTQLRQATRPELVAQSVAVNVAKHAEEHVQKLLGAAIAGVNKSLVPRIEANTDARTRLAALEKHLLAVEARQNLLVGELGLRETIERWAA